MKHHPGIRLTIVFVLGLAGLGVNISSPVALAAPQCDATGANCNVGDIGPGGGTIYYDAGSQQWWGRFLEVKTEPIDANASWSAWGSFSSIYGPPVTQAVQRRSMAIGMGADNTKVLRLAGSPLVLRHFPMNEDWFLPSKDELDALYNSSIFTDANRPKVPVWSSSESETGFAWYQLFQDGTQFTDAQGIIPKLASNVNYSKSQKHVGSEFASLPMHIFKVRAFPPANGTAPQPSLVMSVRENSDCSTKAVNCQVGDKGPAGGIIVYDAGPKSTGGRYYEIAPQACELSGLAFGKPALGATYLSAAMRLAGKAIGAGAANSARLLATRKSPAVVAVANSTCGGFVDWFLPSKDELNEAFRQLSHSRKGLNLTPVGGFQRGYYWTSSDYNGSTAWTQYFADGQQFDRVQTLTGNKQPPARPFMIRPMRRFDAGQVAGGIGLNGLVGQSIVISLVHKTGCGVRSLIGVTTGLAPKTEISIVIHQQSIDSGTLPILFASGVVDGRGRFSVSLPNDDDLPKMVLVFAQTLDLGVVSNIASSWQSGSADCL